jgi:hypothetical protein
MESQQKVCKVMLMDGLSLNLEIPVKLNGTPTSAIPDTAAQKTMVSSQVYTKLKAPPRLGETVRLWNAHKVTHFMKGESQEESGPPPQEAQPSILSGRVPKKPNWMCDFNTTSY